MELTTSKNTTLGTMALRLRALAPATVPGVGKQLLEIADDLEWFEDAYRQREQVRRST